MRTFVKQTVDNIALLYFGYNWTRSFILLFNDHTYLRRN